MKRKGLIKKEIEGRIILWFQDTNRYVVVEKLVALIIQKLIDKAIDDIFIAQVAYALETPIKSTVKFIEDIEKQLIEPIQISTEENHIPSFKIPSVFKNTRFYLINEHIIKIAYQHNIELNQIHAKIAHLEIDKQEHCDAEFLIFSERYNTFLLVNDQLIGCWHTSELHYFEGKIFMKLVELIYNKPEKEWMGVFHASAIEKNGNCILFFGSSGNGKSTSLALLHAHGFNCIADDFVPVACQGDIHSFPAAISIKLGSEPVLSAYYPALKNSEEHHLKRLNKIVKYIPIHSIDYNKIYPCKALVLIKYDPKIELKITPVSNLQTFENLLPDSWISQIPENVSIFLDWFRALPCYEMKYNNHQKMIKSVTKLFDDEL